MLLPGARECAGRTDALAPSRLSHDEFDCASCEPPLGRDRDTRRHAVRLELFERESVWLFHQRRAGRIRCVTTGAAAERRARERNRGRRNSRCARATRACAAAWRRCGSRRGRDDLGRSQASVESSTREARAPQPLGFDFGHARSICCEASGRLDLLRIPRRCRQRRITGSRSGGRSAGYGTLPAMVAQYSRRSFRRRWQCVGYSLSLRTTSAVPSARELSIDTRSCRRLPADASPAARPGGTIRQGSARMGGVCAGWPRVLNRAPLPVSAGA